MEKTQKETELRRNIQLMKIMRFRSKMSKTKKVADLH